MDDRVRHPTAVAAASRKPERHRNGDARDSDPDVPGFGPAPAGAAPGGPLPSSPPARPRPALAVLCAAGLSHGMNDLIQSLIPAVYPVLKSEFALNFGQIGLITLVFQLTASLLQPFVGLYTDHRPKPYSLPIGMAVTLAGLLLLSTAPSFGAILIAAALVGVGSSIFHPEASRVARLASGGRYGMAQSLFQVGGNGGTALGPLLAAYIVVPRGQGSIAWFALVALCAILVLTGIGRWYAAHLGKPRRAAGAPSGAPLPRRTVLTAVIVLMLLVFSKYIYMSSITSYYPFYLMGKFGIGKQDALVHLFVFLGAVAVGTILGGPIGDRFGRKLVIWSSILGVLPFTLLLPHADLFWTTVLSAIIGLVLASAFSAILVFAQELVPERVGMISGLFFGFAFGMAGLGAAVLGVVADRTSIGFVYDICAYLPLLGLLTWFLPDVGGRARRV